MRKLLSHSFTGHSLRSQEPVLEMYAEKVVNRMKSLVKEAAPRQDNRVLINFLDWCSFYSMDIIGGEE
jgi:cytochrome P450